MNCEYNLPNVRHIDFNPAATKARERLGESKPTASSSDEQSLLEGCPDEIVTIQNVTVKFRVTETQVIAQIYPNRLKIEDIKKDLARKFEVDHKRLVLKQCGMELCDHCLLGQADRDEYDIYEFTLELKKISESELSQVDSQLRTTLDLAVYYNKYHLPDFITVHISGEDTDDGNPKDVIVEIQNKSIIKPFLCGYRDKNTGIEYLDAFTQTGPYFDKWKYRRYYSRDVQTHEYKEKLIDTTHDQASQCFQDGNNILYVSSANEVIIQPGKYQTFAQKERIERRTDKIKLLQRNWRRFLFVRYMKKAAADYRRLVANRVLEEKMAKAETEKRLAREQYAKQFPQSREDFELLRGEVLKWKMAELKRIAGLYDGAARIAEVNILLDKEIQLLNGIERQRNLVFKAMQDYREDQLLTKLGRPIKWIGYKDRVIHLDLLRTQRVRFLSEVYKDMRKSTDKETRLQFLAKVKQILANETDFPEFAELVDLVQREVNLLLYTQYCDVEVLRHRQNMLFLDLIKFSKEEKKSKVAQRLCEVCKSVKPLSAFALRTRQEKVDTCKKCYYLKIASTDNLSYASILRAIQRDERRKRCNASFAFVMQLDDIRYIIDRIWHGHSILSKSDEIYNLRLPRWIKNDDWSPWNCICLTESEARDHYKIIDIEKVYDKKILLEVGNRNMLARSAFHNLAAVATEFLETGEWWNVGLNKQRRAWVNRVHNENSHENKNKPKNKPVPGKSQ